MNQRFPIAVLLLLVCLLLPASGLTQDVPTDAVTIRVVDVGAGLCTVTSIPGGHYMVYDAGNYEDQGKTCIKAVEEMIPAGAVIDLLVLSHTDADHLAAVPAICREYKIKEAIRPGINRDTANWRKADAALKQEAAGQGMQDIRLVGDHNAIKPGTQIALGEATVTIVEGYGTPPATWGLIDDSERRNAGSIVVRLEYHGHAVLFTGDTVGRHIGSAPEYCIAAEADMVARAATVPVKADVLIAPHHGADNASANCFIETVHPSWVVFSAGHKFQHPRTVTAERYIAHGVAADHIFRTDLGDDEGSAEWAYGRVQGAVDRRGDDDVEILLPASGSPVVRYR